MKKMWKKVLGTVLAVSLVGCFIGCDDLPDPTVDETVYSISVDKTELSLVEAGDAGTVNVTTNGTASIAVESDAVATAAIADNVITVTPVAAGTTKITVTCTEDTTKTAEIAVTVTAKETDKKDDEEEKKDDTPVTYSLTLSATTASLVLGGDPVSIDVTTNGTVTLEVESEAIATAAYADGKITITPVAAGSTTVIATCTEDSTKKVEIAVTVVKNTMVLTLKLADEIAVPGGSITVKYGSGADTGDTDDDKYTTVDATVAEDGKSATVEFDKSYSNSWYYFNGIVITVKDADGNEQDVSYTNYLEFNADGADLELTKAVSEKTFTINFSGFEIPGGSVEGLTYCNTYADSSSEWEEDNIYAPTVTVEEDGTSASFVVSSDTMTEKNEFYIDWTQVVIKDADDNEITITSGLTENNQWYSYAETDEAKWAITAAYVDTSSSDVIATKSLPSATNSSSVTQLVIADEMPASATSLIFTYKVGADDIISTSTWISIYSDTSWNNTTKLVNAWNSDFTVKEEGDTYSITVADSTVISAFITNGIYIAADSAEYTGKITISYTE